MPVVRKICCEIGRLTVATDSKSGYRTIENEVLGSMTQTTENMGRWPESGTYGEAWKQTLATPTE